MLVVDDRLRQAGEDDEQPQPGLHRRVDARRGPAAPPAAPGGLPVRDARAAAATSSSGVTPLASHQGVTEHDEIDQAEGRPRDRGTVRVGVVDRDAAPPGDRPPLHRPRCAVMPSSAAATTPRAGQVHGAVVGHDAAPQPCRAVVRHRRVRRPRAAPPAPAAAASARVPGRRRRRGTGVGTPACAGATRSRRRGRWLRAERHRLDRSGMTPMVDRGCRAGPGSAASTGAAVDPATADSWRPDTLAPSARHDPATWRWTAAASGGGEVADDRDVLLLGRLGRRARQLGPRVVLGAPDGVREAGPRAGRVTGRRLLEQAVEPAA